MNIKPSHWIAETPGGECDYYVQESEAEARDVIEMHYDCGDEPPEDLPEPIPLYSQETVDKLVAELAKADWFLSFVQHWRTNNEH